MREELRLYKVPMGIQLQCLEYAPRKIESVIQLLICKRMYFSGKLYLNFRLSGKCFRACLHTRLSPEVLTFLIRAQPFECRISIIRSQYPSSSIELFFIPLRIEDFIFFATGLINASSASKLGDVKHNKNTRYFILFSTM